MLAPNHFERIASALVRNENRRDLTMLANSIRMELNPHPADQMKHNVPQIDGQKLSGLQHKYAETVLFFPSQGQTCHAYCTFCFRWPQFTGIDELRFAMRQADLLVEYLRRHPQVTDVLFTGGDPMVMGTQQLAHYLDALLKADLPQVKNIRIGSKSLTFWPYRFLTDPDADSTLRLFERVNRSGKSLAFMAHFNHPRELSTPQAQEAIRRIRDTGTLIRSQAPLMRHINDSPDVWRDLWLEQSRQGIIPYYMFVARDTGAQQYFAVPLVRAWEIFRDAYSQVSGISKTVRGPSMSAGPGKVHVLGVQEIQGKPYLLLNFLQARRADWVGRPFLAEYDPKAIWLDELRPAFGQASFFYEEEYKRIWKNEPTDPVEKNLIERICA